LTHKVGHFFEGGWIWGLSASWNLGDATGPAISRPEAERFLRLRWSSVALLRNIPNTCRNLSSENIRKWPAQNPLHYSTTCYYMTLKLVCGVLWVQQVLSVQFFSLQIHTQCDTLCFESRKRKVLCVI